MNYEQFVVTVKDAVAKLLSPELNLQIHSTLKNNGRKRIGITISDKKVNISPTIYLEEYYERFAEGFPMDYIAKSVADVYHEVKFEHEWQVETIKDFSLIKSKIVYKIIHAEKNEVLLQTLPYVAYLDFAVVFYILFDITDKGTATIPITHELLELWNTDLATLYHIAAQNTKELLPAVVKPMREVIEELLGHPCEDDAFEEPLMFVLSNPLRSFGAACILYKDVLANIGAQLGENFFILPSSIHEVILIPESNAPTDYDFDEMITEINETQVDIEDVLSDHVYYYDCLREKII